jgi:hypothetical protein
MYEIYLCDEDGIIGILMPQLWGDIKVLWTWLHDSYVLDGTCFFDRVVVKNTATNEYYTGWEGLYELRK